MIGTVIRTATLPGGEKVKILAEKDRIYVGFTVVLAFRPFVDGGQYVTWAHRTGTAEFSHGHYFPVDGRTDEEAFAAAMADYRSRT